MRTDRFELGAGLISKGSGGVKLASSRAANQDGGRCWMMVKSQDSGGGRSIRKDDAKGEAG